MGGMLLDEIMVLFAGHLEQIRRCDFSPSGYGIQINGGTGSGTGWLFWALPSLPPLYHLVVHTFLRKRKSILASI